MRMFRRSRLSVKAAFWVSFCEETTVNLQIGDHWGNERLR